MHISQLPIPSTTPPTDSVVSLLGWIVAVLLAGFVAFFWYQERKATKRLEDLVDELGDVRAENRGLHEQLLRAAEKRAEDAKAVAKIILRAERAAPPSDPPPDEYDDIPTDVAIEVVKRRADEPRRPMQKSRPAIELDQRSAVHKPRNR